MSKIGEYVHYNASRYMRYGTTKKTDGKNVDIGLWQNIKKKMYKKAVEKVYSENTVQEIEDKYNAFRKMITTTNSQELTKVREKITSLMMDKFKDINKDTILDFEKGDIYNSLDETSVNKAIKNIKEVKGKFKTDKTGQTSVKYVTENVLKQFTDAYNNLQSISNVSKREEIKKYLEKTESAFLEAVKIENEQLKQEKLIGVHTSETAVTLQTYKNAIDTIRTLIGLNDNRKLSAAKGTFEEYIGAAAALAAEGRAAGVLHEDLEKYILNNLDAKIASGGSLKTKGSIQSDMAAISQIVAKELKDSSFIIKDETGKYSYNLTYESEQKMDVSFMYDPIYGKTAAMSIKNYNLYSKYPISLVTNSPLSTFLYNMGDVNITNHFLNIFAAHNDIVPSTFSSCKKIAEISLSYYLLWAAMSGKGVGKTQGTADIFVVKNNKVKDGVKMWDIGLLVDKIIQKNNLETDLIIEPRLSLLQLSNNYEKGGTSIGDNVQRRISRLLISCHEQKMKVSISPKTLQY